jgi:hypothetical protein
MNLKGDIMTHPSREEWMNYLYNELQKPKKVELDVHLQDCDECKVNIDRWRAVMAELDAWQLPQEQNRVPNMSRRAWLLVRWVAAAVLMITAGYTAGWVSAGLSLDMEHLKNDLEISLKPSLQTAVQQSLFEQMDNNWKLILANNNAQFRKEFENFKKQILLQHNHDLDESAAKILAVSGAVTNQLLRELIYEIQVAQMQNLYRFATALRQVESNRLQDSRQVRNDLQRLVLGTEDVWLSTRQDIEQLKSKNQQNFPNTNVDNNR